MEQEAKPFEYNGKTYEFDDAFIRQVTDYIGFRDNVGKLVEIGAAMMTVSSSLVTLRRNGIERYFDENFPELDKKGRDAAITFIAENFKTQCKMKEGDAGKASKGCC